MTGVRWELSAYGTMNVGPLGGRAVGGTVFVEIRFHSPYRHALLGLAAEILAFALFIGLAGVLALLAAWIA
jgi:hypothetical protein